MDALQHLRDRRPAAGAHRQSRARGARGGGQSVAHAGSLFRRRRHRRPCVRRVARRSISAMFSAGARSSAIRRTRPLTKSTASRSPRAPVHRRQRRARSVATPASPQSAGLFRSTLNMTILRRAARLRKIKRVCCDSARPWIDRRRISASRTTRPARTRLAQSDVAPRRGRFSLSPPRRCRIEQRSIPPYSRAIPAPQRRERTGFRRSRRGQRRRPSLYQRRGAWKLSGVRETARRTESARGEARPEAWFE